MKIIVTDRAEEKLQDIVDYILEQFGGKARKKFGSPVNPCVYPYIIDSL